MTNQLTLKTQYAALLLDICKFNSVDRRRVLDDAGISENLISSSHSFLTEEQLVKLIHLCLKHSEHPSLGLKLGQKLNLMTHGELGQAILSCRTLHQAIELLIRFYQTRIMNCHFEFHKHHHPDTATDHHCAIEITLKLNDEIAYQFMLECILASIVRINVFFFGMKLMHNGQILVTHARPVELSSSPQDDYQKVFYNGIKFDQPKNLILFEAEMLDLEMAMPNESVLRQAEKECQKLLARLPHQLSIKEEVQLLLNNGASIRDLEQIAELMHMSSRTLRRRLTEENCSFRDLVDEYKIRSAKQALSEGKSVEQAAELLGYSDASNFRRSFKRLTGINPSDFTKFS